MVQTAASPEFHGFATKKQEPGLADSSKEVPYDEKFPATYHPLKPGKEIIMLRAILIAGLLCASQAAFSQELTAEQRSACKGDYEKYCKDVTPGGGRIIACLAKANITPACKKVLAEAEKK
jgi:hypothetical protein